MTECLAGRPSPTPELPPATPLSVADQVANAVLYEGYILYPYRASSVKNQQRFNFGGLYPATWCIAQAGSDAARMQTECLLLAGAHTTLDIRVRFLHLVSREVGRRVADAATNGQPEFATVASLEIDGRRYQSWQEAIEREVSLPAIDLREIIQPLRRSFAFAASPDVEPLLDSAGETVAAVTRTRQELMGVVEISAQEFSAGMFRVRVTIDNQTPLDEALRSDREAALLRSFASTHTILTVNDGEFVSLLDPPEEFREAAAACRNIGTWPVLVGADEQRDTLLSSPIILYDYPKIAPESPGSLCDSTEIDEILMLRIMTLTDEEKREMRSVDPRAREILERTEMLPPEQFMKLHGAVRGLRPMREETT